MTMLERYGGFSAMAEIIAAFYGKVLASPSLRRHFDTVDMRSLIDHQTMFVACLMGGPPSFSDDELRRAHRPLQITEADFSEMADLLKLTLEEFKLASADVAQICAEIAARKSLIIG